MIKFRWPSDSDRCLVVGTTGSGKTRAMVNQLSHRSIDRMTWIALDFKGDDTLAQMPVTEIIELGDPVPDQPGLFYILIDPKYHGEGTSEFFHKIYSRGECGVLIDETMVLETRNDGFNQCLFMGRSRGIPMIMGSQRPVEIPKKARNMANFFQILYMGDKDDREAMQKNIPQEIMDVTSPPPGFHSYWFDQQRRWGVMLRPAPGEEESMERIGRRMARLKAIENGDIPKPENAGQFPRGRRTKL